jgi:tetratricopeptide (TPR) repeat protein
VVRTTLLLLVVIFGLNGCDAIVRGVVAPAFLVGYHMSRGVSYYQHRQYDAALGEFNLAVETEPNNIYCLEYRAATYTALHNYNAAIVDLDRAERVVLLTDVATKERPHIVSMRVYAEANAGDNAAAERDELRLARYEPENPGIRDYLAGLYFRQGKVSEAIGAVNEAIAMEPDNTSFYNDRCFYRAASSELVAALADCNVALRRYPTRTLRLYTLSSRALVYVKLRQPANAIADCDAALRIAPANGDSLYLRGIAEKQRHDDDAARRDIAAAVKIEPSLTSNYAVFHLQ